MKPPENFSDVPDVPAKLLSARQTKRLSFAPASFVQRIVRPLLYFLGGILVGVVGLCAGVILSNGDQSAVVPPPAIQGSTLMVQVSSTYINQVAQQKQNTFGVPGTVKNVHVTFVHNGPVTITGDDEMGVLLCLRVTRHFRMDVQVYTNACKPMVRVLRANFSGIPITGIVASFEQSINKQVQSNLTGFPEGFVYCMTSIQTEPQGVTVSFATQPIP
jgi:hypothetical protein